MKYPNLQEEKKLWKKGYKYVVGLDEVGRGALAGPVVASAVVITTAKFKMQKSKCKITNQNSKLFKKIKDSKKLTPKKREEVYKILIRHPQIKWGLGRVSEKVIDKINILEATKLAMKKALKQIQNSKIKNQNDKSKFKIDYLILDGEMTLDLSVPQKSIIKADEKVFSSAIASIIAKVKRDAIMKKATKKYPQYGFDKHKGYATKFHLKMLKKYGPCQMHRKTFKGCG